MNGQSTSKCTSSTRKLELERRKRRTFLSEKFCGDFVAKDVEVNFPTWNAVNWRMRKELDRLNVNARLSRTGTMNSFSYLSQNASSCTDKRVCRLLWLRTKKYITSGIAKEHPFAVLSLPRFYMVTYNFVVKSGRYSPGSLLFGRFLLREAIRTFVVASRCPSQQETNANFFSCRRRCSFSHW